MSVDYQNSILWRGEDPLKKKFKPTHDATKKVTRYFPGKAPAWAEEKKKEDEKKKEEDAWEALRTKMRSTFIEASANGQLEHVVSSVLASRKAIVTSAPLAEIASTPIRRRRSLTIGGVVRNPVLQQESEMPSASPMPSPWSDSTSVRKRHSKSGRKSKEGPDALRLDLGDQTDISERPSSKAGARFRAASTSAMAMDLGLGGSSSSCISTPSTSDLLAAFCEQMWNLISEDSAEATGHSSMGGEGPPREEAPPK